MSVIDGTETRGDTEQARRLGLAIVRQEPALMPDLTVAENLYLGVPAEQRPSLTGVAQWARGLLNQWSGDVAIDANERVVSLSPEQRFIVEIVKALAAKPKVLVLDEPTDICWRKTSTGCSSASARLRLRVVRSSISRTGSARCRELRIA